MTRIAAVPDNLSRQSILALFVGGVAGLVAFELFARLIAPAILGAPLDPTDLIKALIHRFYCERGVAGLAELTHVATAVVFYPLIAFAASRWISKSPAVVIAIVSIATWILALGLFAPLVGAPLMYGFTLGTWVSLVSHVIYAVPLVLVAGYVMSKSADSI